VRTVLLHGAMRTEAPTGPKPGDVLVGCIHLKDFDAHYFHVGGDGLHFQRPGDPTLRSASWILLCTSCFTEHCDDIYGALERQAIKIGRDAVWTDNDIFRLKAVS